MTAAMPNGKKSFIVISLEDCFSKTIDNGDLWLLLYVRLYYYELTKLEHTSVESMEKMEAHSLSADVERSCVAGACSLLLIGR